MKDRLHISLLLIVPLVVLTSTSMASTTWYVNKVSGSDSNNCTSPTTACKTIGHAISLAASGDTIMVAAAIYFEHVGINKNLKIIGSGASATIIDGMGKSTVVTIVQTSPSVMLSRLTIRNGSSLGDTGGGVSNNGTLTINNSTISGNVDVGFCFIFRGCYGGTGGGINNHRHGTLTINNSTISGNVAAGACSGICRSGRGGGIYNQGTLTINNTTVSDNSATKPGAVGGGIYIINGIGIIQNSIVARNTGGNCAGGPIISDGYNLSGDNTCKFNGPGDMNDTNPMLGTLGNYGGPTQTIPLLPGSPAIDAGNPSGCTDGARHLLTTDQRGMPRPDREDTGGCDMGAYEKQSD